MWIIIAAVATVLAVLLVLAAPAVFIVIVAAAVYAFLLHRLGVWRTSVATSIAVSVVRSSTFSDTLPEGVWYVLQFAPLVVAIGALLFRPVRELRSSDRAVRVLLVLLVLAAALSTFYSVARELTLPQTGLLAVVVVFLLATYARRWVDPATIRGDLATVFATLVMLQGVGLVGVVSGGWGFDIDYGRYVGLFSNANYAGVVSAMGIMLGIYLLGARRHRTLILAGLGVLGAGMLMSGSRGAFLAVAAGLLVLVIGRGSRRVVIPVVIAVGLVAVVTVLVDPAVLKGTREFFQRDLATDVSSGRLGIYAGLLEQFQTSPLVGTGYRTSELAAGVAGHNVYLSVLAETGIIGAAILVALIVAVIMASRSGRAHRPLVGATVTVAVMELTESSIFGFGGPTALTAWLIVLTFAANGAYLTVLNTAEPARTRAPSVRAE